MLKINPIGVQTNFKANSSVALAEPPKVEIPEKAGQKETVKKAAVVGGIIAAISAAGVIIYKVAKNKKASVEDIKNAGTKVIQTVEEAIKGGTEAVQKGSSYHKAMEAATFNQTHDSKKIIQAALQKERHARLVVEHTATQGAISSHKAVKSAVGKGHVLSQKANTVTTQEGADVIVAAVKKSQAARQTAIETMRSNYDTANAAQNTDKVRKYRFTRKQGKFLRMAENRDVQQMRQDARTIQKAQANATAAVEKAAKKEASKAAYIASTTVEQRAAQEASNAAAHVRSLDRAVKRKISQPRYQRVLHQMQDTKVWPDAKLQRLVTSNSPKVTPLEKEIAEYILSIRAGV